MIFHADGQRGCGFLATYFAALPHPANTKHRVTARFLGVTEKTLRAWLSGTRQPPPPVVALLWHECHHGRAALDSHAHQGMIYAQGVARGLQAENDRLRAIIRALESDLAAAQRGNSRSAANCAAYSIPGAPVDYGRA